MTPPIDPDVVKLLFWSTCLMILCAHVAAVREAWPVAAAKHPRKGWRFVLSLIAREQLYYAKRVPLLIVMVISSVVIAAV